MRPKAAGLMETSLDFVKDVSKKLAAGTSLALAITLALLALSIVGFLSVALAFWDWAQRLSITSKKASPLTTSPR